MILIAILLVVLVVLLAISYEAFRRASIAKKPISMDDEEQLKKHDRWAPLTLETVQWLRKHHSRELTMISFDGLKLRGRWVAAENPRGTILLVHGWNGRVESDFTGIIPACYEMGMNLLLIDQRAQNGSQGKYMTFGVKESQDVADWVRFHNKTFGDLPLVLGGVSMGAATVLMATGRELPPNVCGVVADCGFTSPWEIFKDVAKRKAHIPTFPILYFVRFWCQVLAGYDPKAYSTVTAMKKNKLPVLLIHGLADDFVPCHMSQTNYDACQSVKDIVLVESAGHAWSYLTAPERCREALEKFFAANLQQKG